MGYSSICYAHYTPLAYPLPNPLAMGYIPISVHVRTVADIQVSVMRIYGYLLRTYYSNITQTLY